MDYVYPNTQTIVGGMHPDYYDPYYHGEFLHGSRHGKGKLRYRDANRPDIPVWYWQDKIVSKETFDLKNKEEQMRVKREQIKNK